MILYVTEEQLRAGTLDLVDAEKMGVTLNFSIGPGSEGKTVKVEVGQDSGNVCFVVDKKTAVRLGRSLVSHGRNQQSCGGENMEKEINVTESNKEFYKRIELPDNPKEALLKVAEYIDTMQLGEGARWPPAADERNFTHYIQPIKYMYGLMGIAAGAKRVAGLIGDHSSL